MYIIVEFKHSCLLSLYATAYTGCYSTEGCDPVSSVNASSAEECCLGQGFYYSDGTNCTQCIGK